MQVTNGKISHTAARLRRLGVDLDKYPGVTERQTFEPIVSGTDRQLLWSLARSYRDQLLYRTPDPCMLTHILTTRCNYNCGFCSFADSLNVKHSDLTLPEIERFYKTLGASLNAIVTPVARRHHQRFACHHRGCLQVNAGGVSVCNFQCLASAAYSILLIALLRVVQTCI
ncbi:MAG: hypothetical protein IPL73_30225 [Candidatus Obscuribacter sp.]|nr:hypothetical protein [Candidatus Obscuribacter sp.]